MLNRSQNMMNKFSVNSTQIGVFSNRPKHANKHSNVYSLGSAVMLKRHPVPQSNSVSLEWLVVAFGYMGPCQNA